MSIVAPYTVLARPLGSVKHTRHALYVASVAANAKSSLQGDETRDSKTVETRRCKPRKGGVSCGTFKRGISINRILSCLYISVSGGHQRPVAGTLTRLTKHLKLEKCRARLKKRRMSLLKKGAKIHLKNERKIIRPTPPKIRNRNGPQTPPQCAPH
jgi:hypothetical protein